MLPKTITEKFTFFKFYVLNQRVEISSPQYPYQCMDLIYTYNLFLNYPKDIIQYLFAYEVFTKFDLNPKAKLYYKKIENTATNKPETGDIVVFNKTTYNKAGHVSIATGNSGVMKFESIDQNWGGFSRVSVVSHNYTSPKVLGWLKPIVF